MPGGRRSRGCGRESGRLITVDRVPYGAGEGDREPDGCTSLSILAARDRSIRENGIDLAIVRRHGEQVYAGPADAIDRLLADPAIENPDLVRLAVGTPSHSSYHSSAASAFQTALTESTLASPAVPVLAGVSGRRIRTRDQAIDALSRQIRSTLRWDSCMSALVEGGIETVIELGPGNDLAKIIELDHPRISARSVTTSAIGAPFPAGSRAAAGKETKPQQHY